MKKITSVNWQVQTLRVSLFPSATVAHNSDLWKRFTGYDPESAQNRIKESITIYSGPFNTGLLNLIVTPIRIDLILTPPGTIRLDGAPDIPQVFVGNAAELISNFRSRAPEFISQFGEGTRIAFAGSVFLESGSVKESYERILSLLKSVKFDPNKGRELVYRINWRTKSNAVKDIELNRVTVWSSVKIQMTQQTVPIGEGRKLFEQDFVQLEFDMNNSPVNDKTFSPTELSGLLEEFCSLAEENMEYGEVVSA